jgi:hypothetical protein
VPAYPSSPLRCPPWLALPVPPFVVDPGQADDLVVDAADKVCHRTPGEIRRTDAFPDVAAGPAQAAVVVQPDSGEKVARHSQRAAPRVRYGDVAQNRKQLAERLAQCLVDSCVAVELRLDLRAKVVWRAPAAKGDAVIGRALTVDDEVPQVGECLAVSQPDLVQDRLRQRLRGDHQGVNRRERAALAADVPCVGLRCAHDVARSRSPMGADRGSRRDAVDRGLLIDRYPPCLDRIGEAAGQPRWMDGGAMGRVDRGKDAFGGGDLARLTCR